MSHTELLKPVDKWLRTVCDVPKFKEFEDRVFAKNTVVKGEPFFNLVFDYATLYTSLFVDRDILPADAPELSRYRALIYIMNDEFSASEWRACLLHFAHRFHAARLPVSILECKFATDSRGRV